MNHSNIGAIYGVEDAAGIPALVLELVEGPTLEERIAAGPVRSSFSRDGQQLAFVSNRGNRLGIWTMAAENETPRLVAATRILDGVSWSPDGRRLVAAIPGPTEPSLVTIGVGDGKIEQLTTPAGRLRIGTATRGSRSAGGTGHAPHRLVRCMPDRLVCDGRADRAARPGRGRRQPFFPRATPER